MVATLLIYNQAKSELLNTQFLSVFTANDGSDLPVLDPSQISSNLLKLLAYEVSPCLALLFTASLQQSIVPPDWRKASVCPIFK